ncbi:MAG: pantoate--beta-alanine ligase [Phycisphaerales bacterium JB037]
MRIVTKFEELAVLRGGALVPTMGAMHPGHERLFDRAVREAEARGLDAGCVVSIFVNPTQFNDPRDFEVYPRTLESDLAICERHGVSAVFTPAVEVMYPPDASIPPPPLPVQAERKGLEDEFRPGHFPGVCQVCSRLFDLLDPAAAVFGEKDWQQLVIVRAMCRLQGRNLAILGEPTARDPDGLAMSSRNQHLTPADRAAALSLSQALKLARGIDDPRAAEAAMVDHMRAAGAHPEYAAVRDADTLEPIDAERDRPARVLVAARVGTTRLLDNAAWPGSTDTLD